MVKSSRSEFSGATKKLIATAVNWQCSVPLCKIPALGVDNGQTLNGGTACHIFSAAENGPRGRGGLSDKELKDPDNGLWCCASHGRIIDSQQGKSFPAAQLRMWKKLAEGRVRRAMAVEFAELGWMNEFSIDVEVRAGAHWSANVVLHKNNLLRGSGPIGKTLLLEALGSISDNGHAWRLRRFPRFSVTLAYETLTSVQNVAICCDKDGPILRRHGGAPSAIPPHDMVVMYLPTERIISVTNRSAIQHVAHIIGVDEDVLYGLARSVTVNPNSGMSIDIRRRDPAESDSEDDTNDDDGPEVFVKLDRKGFELTFYGLSSGERTRVAGALLIALAREEVKSRPVLLCIDALWLLDDTLFHYELARLAEENIQLLVVAPHDDTDTRALSHFSSWNVVDLPSIQVPLSASL